MESAESTTTQGNSGVRVLAADDDPSLQRLVERCMRSWGHEVRIAEDGAEAWHLLRTEPLPDVLILDWDMPRLDGIEVVRLVRAHEHGDRVAILVLTGRGGEEDGRVALEAGADDFFRKPFNSRELQLRVARVAKLKAASLAAPVGEPSRRSPRIGRGSVLGGRYRLERPLAAGGMASVWIARHLPLGIEVAVKLMSAELADVPDYASFESEARLAAQLRHRHIVQVYDHGIADGGVPYMVMEYLPGDSLADCIARNGPMPAARVAGIVREIAHALEYAHERQVVHRDVKPDNILLRPDGHAKLVDFGLAIMTQTAKKGARTVGTPCYMAPEVLLGEVGVAPSVDVWSLAVTAFTALTGTLAFDGASLSELIGRICVDDPPLPSQRDPRVTPEIDAWFAKACHHDLRERFTTPLELALALERAIP